MDFKRALHVFLGLQPGESGTRKGILVVAASIALRVSEWYFIVPAAFAMVVGLTEVGLKPWYIVFFMSLLNAIFSFCIIYANDRLKIDITGMEGASRLFERAARSISRRNVFFSHLGNVWFFIWNVFYQGPAYAYLLIRKKPWVEKNWRLLVLTLSFFQMIPWTFLYILGYETLLDFLAK